MAKIPPLTTLRVEDFESEQRKWLPRLFTPLNQFLTAASNVINGKIEFAANIPAIDQNLSFTYGGAAQRFRWTLDGTPSLLWVGQATEDDEAVTLIASWSFDSSTKVISVNFTKFPNEALIVGSSYRVFVRVVP